MTDRDPFASQRDAMVREQIERRGIHDPRVLEALRAVPRHAFLLPDQQEWAYTDGALRIEMGQTISQPYIVALMSSLLDLRGDERVLEVGTGSGYQAAVLAHLAREVYSVERHAPLVEQAGALLEKLGINNVQISLGDGSLGWPEKSPFDGILVTAAAPEVPPSLLNQLAEGGRLVIPVGGKHSQTLEVWQRTGEEFAKKVITAVAFVPLVGEEGWQEKDWKKFRFW